MLHRKVISLLLALATLLLSPTQAIAHQPVNLTAKDSSADRGPILVDGTISFAIRANFDKANQTQGFRLSLKEDQLLNFEYLIIDRSPENKLSTSRLPVATITDPRGEKIVVKLTQRSKFYEPYSKTNYLYLAKFSKPAIEGIYKITLRSKVKSAITVAVGTQETFGQVLSAATCPNWQRASDEAAIELAYAQALVGMRKESAKACAEKLGWQYRIGQEDDQLFALTRDYRIDRVTVTIKKGLITQIDVG